MHFLKTGFAAAALLVSAASANASVISYSHSTSGALSIPFTDSFTLQQFDTGLGTLNSVTITLSTSITTISQVTNIFNSTDSFSAAIASLPVSVSGPSAFTLGAMNTAGPFSGTIGPNAVVTAGTTTGSYSGFVNVAPVDFGTYSGAGTAFLSFAFSSVRFRRAARAFPGMSSSAGTAARPAP